MPKPTHPDIEHYPDMLDRVKKAWVIKVLTIAQGRMLEAARLSGMHRANLARLMRKYGLRWED